MQLIMLNMLLAVVAAANARVHSKAKLVASYERTRLVLASERLLVNQGRAAGGAAHGAAYSHASRQPSGTMRALCWWCLDRHAERRKLERVCPPWLHVLLPPKAHDEEDGAAAARGSDLRRLNELRAKIASQRPVRLQAVPAVPTADASRRGA
eukprot:1000760-Prymnesium_polylepis.1